MNFTLEKKTYPQNFHVMPKLQYDAIIGSDFIIQARWQIDLSDQSIVDGNTKIMLKGKCTSYVSTINVGSIATIDTI